MTPPRHSLDTAPPRTAPPAPEVPAAVGNGTFRSLRNRNFRLFLTGQLISQTGTWMTTITQTLLVLSLTRSGIALGLLAAFQFGPVLMFGAWAGAVADRADKRTLLMRIQSLSMLVSLTLGVVVLAGWASIPLIFALAAVQGVLTAFDNPTRRAFVVEMVPESDVPNAVSLNSAVMTGSRVVGPAMAGALVLWVGHGWPFIVDAITYLAVLTGLLVMRPADLFRTVPMARGKGQVRQGLRYIADRPELFVPLVMMAIIGTFAFNFSVTVPLLVDGPLGGGTTTFTWLFSVLSVGSVTGALLTARRTEVTPTHLVVSAGAFGVAMLMLAVAPALWVTFPVMVGLGLASISFMTSCTSIVQLLAGPTYRGRVLAIQAMVFLGSKPIGGPILGWISDSAGPRAGIAVGGMACLVAAAYGARKLGLDPRNLRSGTEPVGPIDSVALAD